MLPTTILDHLTDKQTIRASASMRIQAAFLTKLTKFVVLPSPASSGLETRERGIRLSHQEAQELALAPRIEVGQPGGITDEEADQLGAYLLKAFQGYHEAYTSSEFPDPVKAATCAMRRFILSF